VKRERRERGLFASPTVKREEGKKESLLASQKRKEEEERETPSFPKEGITGKRAS